MTTRTTRIAIALSAALVATTAVAPLASARDWRPAPHHEYHPEPKRGHDNTAAWVGLGIAALAGAAIVASAAPAQPVYAAPPAYVPPPAYVQPAPTCTTINGYAACIGPDGNWQYVR